MIPLQHFKSLSPSEKKQYLRWIVENIESQTNQVLMMCKKLLITIEDPSEKLLLYIYQTIFSQITSTRIETQKAIQKKHETLIKSINHQEIRDQQKAENILAKINNF